MAHGILPRDREVHGQMVTVKTFSPNVSKRRKPVTTVVVHNTGSESAASAVAWLTNAKSNVSAHYVVAKDGTVHQLAMIGSDEHPGDVTWHAGVSRGPNGFFVNNYSIGVELVGMGDKYTKEQYEALNEIIRLLKERFKSLKWVTGHSDVCLPKGRKVDPGAKFDWSKVEGLQKWSRN